MSPGSPHALSDNPLSLAYPGDAPGTASARHGTPSRSIAQHRTNSFRANATTAGFFRLAPPAVSRPYTARAHGLYRSMHHAHSTNSFRSTPGPRRVIRPCARVNARDALVPPQVDRQNGVGLSRHRKPPRRDGRLPVTLPHSACMDSFGSGGASDGELHSPYP